CSRAGLKSSRSTRPIISSIVRKPRAAMCPRTSWARNRKKCTPESDSPAPRPRGEPTPLAAEQRGDDHVAPGLHLAVDLDDDPIAQLVQHEDLLRLGEPELPGHAAVLDRGERRGARAALVA